MRNKSPFKSSVFSLFISVAIISPAMADTNTASGRITKIYADPSDVVVALDKGGPCGSTLFHFQRAKDNFKEIVSLIYLAAASKYPVEIVVASCSNDRNIASHGSVNF